MNRLMVYSPTMRLPYGWRAVIAIVAIVVLPAIVYYTFTSGLAGIILGQTPKVIQTHIVKPPPPKVRPQPPPPPAPAKPKPKPPTPASGIESTHTTPPYPPFARRLNQKGKVLRRIAIGAGGHVNSAAVIKSSGHSELDSAAKSWVVQHWRYKPATQNGKPVASQEEVQVVFNLKQAG